MSEAVFCRDKFLNCFNGSEQCELLPVDEVGQGVLYLTTNNDTRGSQIAVDTVPELRRRGTELITSGLIRIPPDQLAPVLEKTVSELRSHGSDALWETGLRLIESSGELKKDQKAYAIRIPMFEVGNYFAHLALSDCDQQYPAPNVSQLQQTLDSYARKLNVSRT